MPETKNMLETNMLEKFNSKKFMSDCGAAKCIEFCCGMVAGLTPFNVVFCFVFAAEKGETVSLSKHLREIKYSKKMLLKGFYTGSLPYVATGSAAFGIAKGLAGQFTAPFIGAHRQKIKQKPDSFAGFNPNRVSTKIADGISYPAYQIGRLCYKIFGNSR